MCRRGNLRIYGLGKWFGTCVFFLYKFSPSSFAVSRPNPSEGHLQYSVPSRDLQWETMLWLWLCSCGLPPCEGLELSPLSKVTCGSSFHFSSSKRMCFVFIRELSYGYSLLCVKSGILSFSAVIESYLFWYLGYYFLELSLWSSFYSLWRNKRLKSSLQDWTATQSWKKSGKCVVLEANKNVFLKRRQDQHCHMSLIQYSKSTLIQISFSKACVYTHSLSVST